MATHPAPSSVVCPAVGAPELPGGVVLVDPPHVLRRSRVATSLQPLRRTRGPAGGVDDEIGGKQARGPAVAAGDEYAVHPGVVGREGQVEDRGALEDLDARVGQQPVADVPLEQRPAHGQQLQAAPPRRQWLLREVPSDISLCVAPQGTSRLKIGRRPREQLLDDLAAASQQPVGVPPLGDTPTGHRLVRHLVPVHHGDPVEMGREGPSGEQARHAGPDHDRVLVSARHRGHPTGARIAPVVPGTWFSQTSWNAGCAAVRSATLALPSSGLGQNTFSTFR